MESTLKSVENKLIAFYSIAFHLAQLTQQGCLYYCYFFHRCCMDRGQCCYLGVSEDFNPYAVVIECHWNAVLWGSVYPL